MTTVTDMRDGNGTIHFKPTDGSRMALLHTGKSSVNNTTSTLRQSTNRLQAGKVYLITFDYNFMSNEFPSGTTCCNDTFRARALSILVVEESRNSSNFKTDKPLITTNGNNNAGVSDFSLGAGNGYTNWKTASKTFMTEDQNRHSQFRIADDFDALADSGVLIDNVKVELDPPLMSFPTDSR